MVKSIGTFLLGILKRAWLLVPGILLGAIDFYNIYAPYLRSQFSASLPEKVDLPTESLPYVLVAGILIAAAWTYHKLWVTHEQSKANQGARRIDELREALRSLLPGSQPDQAANSFSLWTEAMTSVHSDETFDLYTWEDLDVDPSVPFIVMCHFLHQLGNAGLSMGLKLNGAPIGGESVNLITQDYRLREGNVTWHVGAAEQTGTRRIRMQWPTGFTEYDFGTVGAPAQRIRSIVITGCGEATLDRISIYSVPG